MIPHWLPAAAAAFVALGLAPAAAQDPKQDPPRKEAEPQQDPLAELKQRMKGRYADLERLRDAGKVGETWNGEIAAVKPAHEAEKVDPKDEKSQTIGQLLTAENGDRRQLYAQLAKDLKTSADEVARQNGLRNFDKAKPDHWLRLQDGRWVQRKDVKPKKEPKPEPEKKDGEEKDGAGTERTPGA